MKQKSAPVIMVLYIARNAITPGKYVERVTIVMERDKLVKTSLKCVLTVGDKGILIPSKWWIAVASVQEDLEEKGGLAE